MNRVNADGTITAISSNSMQSSQDFLDPQTGLYSFSQATLPRPGNGTGYMITLQFYQWVSDGKGGRKQIFGEVGVTNITITSNP